MNRRIRIPLLGLGLVVVLLFLFSKSDTGQGAGGPYHKAIGGFNMNNMVKERPRTPP